MAVILNTGTHDISSLLATNDVSVAEYGMDKTQDILVRDLAAHNMIVMAMLSELAERTGDRQRRYGVSTVGQMQEVDEYGPGSSQKNLPGSTVGFPLKKFTYPLAWTNDWFKMHTPADMAVAVIGAQTAHKARIQLDIKKALFESSNYTSVDRFVDNIDLAVKRLANADGMTIPNGPNGETYDGATHTHYNANATLTAAAVTATINDVVEHGHGSMVKVGINLADETAFRALTGFVAYADPRLIYVATDVPGQRLDISRMDNRAIGIFGAAEVWVKSWVPANYLVVWAAGDGNKPLVFREHPNAAFRGLRLAATFDAYPLYAEWMEAYHGVAVWTRTNGAVLRFNDAAYADPAF